MTQSTEYDEGFGSRPKKLTIAEVAKSAGVSPSTVSKVLNGRADVSANTRDRVERLIREGGYRRRRATQQPGAPLIDLLFHELESPWAIEVIRGVERVARDQGVGVVLSECINLQTPDKSWTDAVLARRPVGVILVFSDLSSTQRAQLRSRQIPFVVVDPVGDPLPDVPSVGSANWSGGLSATRHLIQLGHRRIAVIGGPSHVLCVRARIDGYRTALNHAGIPVDEALVRHGDFHTEGGRRLAHELLRLADPPTAIFAGNDLQALGVYEAAREMGLRIPEDISVVGYDDLPLARWVGPPLTTVRQPLVEMAEEATRMVLALSRGIEPPNRRLDLATSLVVRASTQAPRA